MKQIPKKDMREHPELVSGMTAYGQWSYSRQGRIPQVPVKRIPGLPAFRFPCSPDELAAFFAAQVEARGNVKISPKDLTVTESPAILTSTVGKRNNQSRRKVVNQMAKSTPAPKRGRGRPPFVVNEALAAIKANGGKPVAMEVSSAVTALDRSRKLEAAGLKVTVTLTVARKRAPRTRSNASKAQA